MSEQPEQPRAARPGLSRRAYRGGAQAAARVTRGNSALMAEFIIVMAIVILRMLADYVPADDKSKPGEVRPDKGLAPLPLAAAAVVTWFLLATLATASRRASQIATAFGALLILALLFNSHAELAAVSTWIDHFGDWSPAPPQAQASTPVPQAAGGTSDGGVTPGVTPGVPKGTPLTVKPVNGKCPPGYLMQPDGMCHIHYVSQAQG